MPEWFHTCIDRLSQFTGGSGSVDRFLLYSAIAAMVLSAFAAITYLQNRSAPLPREALLRRGIAVSLGKELLMSCFALAVMLGLVGQGAQHSILLPIEYAASGIAQVIFLAGVMRILIPETPVTAIYLRVGVILNLACAVAAFCWPGQYDAGNGASVPANALWSFLFIVLAACLDGFATLRLAWRSRGANRSILVSVFLVLMAWDATKLSGAALVEIPENRFFTILHFFRVASILLLGILYVGGLIAWRLDAERTAADLAARLEGRIAERTAALKKVEAAELTRSRQALRLQQVLFEQAKGDKSDFEAALRSLLRAAGQALDVERISYWSAAAEMNALTRRCLCRSRSAVFDSRPVDLLEARFPAYFRALNRMTQIVAEDARTHEDTSELTAGYLNPLGIASMLVVPVWHCGSIAGFLCCEHVGMRHAWAQAEVDFVTATVEILAHSLESSERKAAEDALLLEQRRQAALVELEAAINRQDELQSVLDHIAVTVTRLLPATAASVVLWNPGNESFTVSASTVPGQTAQAGAQRVRRSGGASRTIIETCAPVVTPDISKDPYQANELLRQFGMQAYAGVPLLSDGKALGVLYAIDRDLRDYAPQEISFLSAIANRATTALVRFRLYESLRQSNIRLEVEVEERKKAEMKISASLREKEVLIQEVHHRVKNNLTLVSSLLNLQAWDQSDPGLKAVFAESQQRIRSMALVHEMLYQSENLAEIEFGDYLHALVPALMPGTSGPAHITCDIQCEHIALLPQTAVPLALIVNELVTNSVKHAFSPGQEGRISITCRHAGQSGLVLTVQDNGIGLPAAFDPQMASTLGLRLVGMMIRQLRARLEAGTLGGAFFTITFSQRDEFAQSTDTST